jgi:hypothetical protein
MFRIPGFSRSFIQCLLLVAPNRLELSFASRSHVIQLISFRQGHAFASSRYPCPPTYFLDPIGRLRYLFFTVSYSIRNSDNVCISVRCSLISSRPGLPIHSMRSAQRQVCYIPHHIYYTFPLTNSLVRSLKYNTPVSSGLYSRPAERSPSGLLDRGQVVSGSCGMYSHCF